jgi:hypothetical protein
MLLVYDCSLTLGMEIEFVWSSPGGFVKVLYIVQRYLPFCDAIFLCLPREYMQCLSLYNIHHFLF